MHFQFFDVSKELPHLTSPYKGEELSGELIYKIPFALGKL
jgi:hypothetical protein